MAVTAYILVGYGINCDRETEHAFKLAGAKTKAVHIDDVRDHYFNFKDCDILVIPGGFSFGDDTGSGNAFANRIRNNLWDDIENFICEDKLLIGICNGFQILVNLGLLPASKGEYGKVEAALTYNKVPRYTCRWVDLKLEGKSPFVKGIDTISVPVAHGEGCFYTDNETLNRINKKKLVAARYFKGNICEYFMLEGDPNGSLDSVAALTDETGRIFGSMPHFERAVKFTQLPNWTDLREEYTRSGIEIPEEGPGLKVFKNAVNYFR